MMLHAFFFTLGLESRALTCKFLVLEYDKCSFKVHIIESLINPQGPKQY